MDPSADNDVGQCGATVEYAGPVVDDQASVTCTPGSGSFYPVGTTETTCVSVVGDGVQNAQRSATCSFDVTVVDAEAPGLTCPAVETTTDPGLCSGLMIAEVTSAALMSENKQMASPCSVDSTPTSANQEDHVSMGCHAARRLGPMTGNLARILGNDKGAEVLPVKLKST